MPVLRMIACLLTWLCTPAWAAPDADMTAFSATLAQATTSSDFVGLAVAVVRDGDIVLLHTFGTRDIHTQEAVTPDTVFRIASLSKGFSATLAALLVADGKLSWQQPVAALVPAFALKDPQQAQTVTVQHILSHRLGLPPYAYDNLLEAGRPLSNILSRYKNVRPLCNVGECYAYQNVGFNMIADIVASVDQRAFERSMQERIFTPLGLNSASIGREALTSSANWARPHVRRRNGPWRTSTVNEAYYNVPAAGGINASIRDMAQWLTAQMGGVPDVLPPAVLDALHSPQVTTRAETRRMRALRNRLQESHYGYGWRIYDYGGHTVINHSGSVKGYMAQVAFVPEKNIGIAILANTTTRRGWRILPTFLDAQLGFSDTDWLAIGR